MAELIVKNALIREIESVSFTEDAKKMKVGSDAEMDGFFKGYVEGMLYFIPTTTEAEIRAKAYEEVFELLKSKRDKKTMKVNLDDLEIRKYKEQLKEE